MLVLFSPCPIAALRSIKFKTFYGLLPQKYALFVSVFLFALLVMTALVNASCRRSCSVFDKLVSRIFDAYLLCYLLISSITL